jgi:hypothetical protein
VEKSEVILPMPTKVTEWVLKNNFCEKAKCSFYNKEDHTCNMTYSEYWKHEYTDEEILRELKIGRCPNMYWYGNWAVIK